MKSLQGLILFSIFVFASCSRDQEQQTLFRLTGLETGIQFSNDLSYTQDFNPYIYRNFYNGGGVALGDINNDGLLDIYFTGNLVDNKLYLNKGNWKFEDITVKAGVACPDVWSTGATFVDLNGDGLLDLYVCKSGKPGGENRHNELFINNGDLTFSEQSEAYGLNINGLSVQAAFFDYDKDGDLDCYLLNNSLRSVGAYDFIENQRTIPAENSNKFLKNENGHFVDISEEAGIYHSSIGFGLGITLSDFNQDNWPDLYISNDFFEKDYLYLNKEGAGFEEKSDSLLHSLSMGSMGADAGDLDNDLQTDLMVSEMLPENLSRKKTKAVYETWDKYALAVKKGYGHQFPRNVLQRNLGPTGFYEISRHAGVDATEWSWSTLFFDMNNDGLKDIFISNGIYKDLLDRDYLNFVATTDIVKAMMSQNEAVIKNLIDSMPSTPIPNSAFLNQGDFNFKNAADSLGLAQPGFSNGSVYGDLDNDGDLDLVVNNVNMPAFVYENKTDTAQYRSVKIRLQGSGLNTRAIGARLVAYMGEDTQVFENYPSRGYQSAIAPEILIGIGSHLQIDSLKITWPNNKESVVRNLLANTTHTLSATTGIPTSIPAPLAGRSILQQNFEFPEFRHQENIFIDFKQEQLMDRMVSNEGPALAQADVNGDGIPDFYVGGAKNQPSQLYRSMPDGTYETYSAAFINDQRSEDTDALFFDSDGDGDLDLYVCSGGKAFSKYDTFLHDRLYINDGGGEFRRSSQRLPFTRPISSSSVAAADIDLDGDIDLFVGERFDPESYGIPGSGYLLINQGENVYVIEQEATFKDAGLITDVSFSDLNGDDWPDLIVAGEWMPIRIFMNLNGSFEEQTPAWNMDHTIGIWNTILARDIDKDGDVDLIAGNIGSNYVYKKGTTLFYDDFDQNGRAEQLICQHINGKYYPILDKDELIAQLPLLKKNLLYYRDYAVADMNSIFGEKFTSKADKRELDRVTSAIFLNEGKTFRSIELPAAINYSSVYGICLDDIDENGVDDLILGGNQYLIKPQFGRLDASRGWLVKDISNTLDKSGLNANPNPLGIEGQIRKIEVIQWNGKKLILIAMNNDNLRFYELQ